MNHQFQTYVPSLKASTDRRKGRVENTGDADLFIGCDGISHSPVKGALISLHTGRVAGREHADHDEGERLSQRDNFKQDYMLDDKVSLRQW